MNIYIIGIGGAATSAVARLLKGEGHTVVGSDAAVNSTVRELRGEGFDIFEGHAKEQLPLDCDLVILSPSVITVGTAADYLEAKERGIPMTTWQEYLGEIMKDKITIAICGTHGKSTTTAMTTRLLIEAGLDPTVVVGTKLKELNNTNIRIGKSKYFIVEADEFYENFLHYTPTYILCTNYEVDHLDYFQTSERYRQAFVKFFAKAAERDGMVITHEEEGEAIAIAEEVAVNLVITPGPVPFTMAVPGEFNRMNAALVDALGDELGIGEDVRAEAIVGFSGTWRRMEVLGKTSKGALVIDDYAHHPTEVRATLGALREAHPDKRIVCVFQPHQYTRLRACYEEFVQCFSDCDVLMVPNIYSARDSEAVRKGISAKGFVEDIGAHHGDARYSESFDETYMLLLGDENINNAETLIAVLGAGDVTELAHRLVV